MGLPQACGGSRNPEPEEYLGTHRKQVNAIQPKKKKKNTNQGWASDLNRKAPAKVPSPHVTVQVQFPAAAPATSFLLTGTLGSSR